MRRTALTLSALLALGAAGVVAAQTPSPARDGYWQEETPNVRAWRDYRDSMSVYDAQVDAYARQRQAYDADTQDYMDQRRAFEHRYRDWERARADYDADYGPGAYERYYPAPYWP